jgi:hypothetical protein
MAAHLRSISPDASPEEVAAILGALGVRRAAYGAPPDDDTLHEWVRAARLQSHRSGLQRGPWRLSGRLSRRARA